MKYDTETLTKIYQRVVGSMSGLADIKVQVIAGSCPQWQPKNKLIVVPGSIPYADTDEESFVLERGIVVHEAGHVLFCPPDPPLVTPSFREWSNIFEDVNNEFKVVGVWPHLKKPLTDKCTKLIQKNPKVLKTDNPMMQVLLRCDALSTHSVEFPPDYPDLLKDFVTETVNDFKVNNIHSCDGQLLIDFSQRVSERWDLLVNEAKSEKGRKLQDLMKRLGEMVNPTSKNKGTPQEIDKIKKKIADINAADPLNYKDKIDERFVAKRSNTGEATDYSHLSLEEIKEMLKKNAQKDEGLGCEGGWGSGLYSGSIPISGKVDPVSDQEFNNERLKGKEVNQLLRKKIAVQEDYENRQRSGRIDIDEIRKQVGNYGTIVNENLFSRPNDFTRGGSWAISVLIDSSGSMQGRKIKEAKSALATIAAGLDGLPNVKYELVSFKEVGYPVDLFIKKFEDSKVNFDRINGVYAGSGNQDGYNIRSAIKRLIKFKTMKKVLFVISDGQPAYSGGVEDTKKAVSIAKKFGVEVVGIGIQGVCENAHKEIYPNRYIYQNNDNLGEQLAELILSCVNKKKNKRFVNSRGLWKLTKP